jgi:hypothetical protein
MPPRLAAPFFTAILIALATSSGCGPSADAGAGGKMGGGGSFGGGGGGADAAIDATADLPGSGGSIGTGGATTMTDATSERTGDATTMTDATSERPEVGGNFCAGHVFEGGPIPDVTAPAFCAKYGAVCKFGGAGGYASMADCLTQYGGVVPVLQGCRASGLCDAASIELQPGVTVEFLQAYCTRALTFAACN